MDIYLGIIFGLISMFSYGIANTIAKIPLKLLGCCKTILFRESMITLILLVTLLFFLKAAIFSPIYILIAILIAFLGYLPLYFFYKSLNIGKIGIVTPIANSSAIFAVPLSIVFFHESLKLNQIFAIVLIILGIFFISFNLRDFKRSQIFDLRSGIPLALLACFLWGIVFFLFKIPTNILGPFLTSFIIELGITIIAFLHMKSKKESFSLDKKLIPILFFLAIFGAAALLFFNIGIIFAPVSIIAPLTFANPLIATILGAIFFKEKLKVSQYTSIAFIILGIILISI